MTDFFKTMTKGINNEYAAVAADGVTAGDVTDFMDTGSYMFNALMSGSIFGGIPNNKITAIAGEEATGKTFFVLGVIKHFLDNEPEGVCIFFESESAISKNMIEDRGIDSTRVMIVPVTTIQEFRTQSLKILDNYEKQEEKRPMIMALDSFGMLSTTKEIEDTLEGSETKDMTRAAIAKATFRVLTLKLGKIGIPLLVTNHTYDSMSMYGGKQMGGGCVVPETVIRTQNGLRRMEDVVVDSWVETKDGFGQVTDKYFYEKPCYEIVFEDGHRVICSEDHRFLSEGEWITTREIAEKDLENFTVVQT